MQHKAEAPVVVLSPHLDDAVLSAWSVLRRPGDVAVVNVCTGAPAAGSLAFWDRLTGAADSAARMRERLAEDVEALAIAGRSAVNLGLLDAQYRDGEPLDAGALREAIASALPAASLLVAPAGIGAHGDHVAVRDAALELAQDSGAPLELYADLPYCARFGWPAWVTGEPPRPHLHADVRWREDMASVAAGGARPEPLVERLAEREAECKLRALRAYVTQWDALDAGPLAGISGNGVLRFEVRWRLAAGGHEAA